MSKSVQPSHAQTCVMVLQLVAVFRQRAAVSNIWRWLYTKDNTQALVNAPVYHAPKPLPNEEGSEGEALPSSSAMTCVEAMIGPIGSWDGVLLPAAAPCVTEAQLAMHESQGRPVLP